MQSTGLLRTALFTATLSGLAVTLLQSRRRVKRALPPRLALPAGLPPRVDPLPRAAGMTQAPPEAAGTAADTAVSTTAAATAPANETAPPASPPSGRFASVREYGRFMKEAVSAWLDDYAPSMGAALSYYTLFSVAPLVLIVVSLAGLVFGEEAARGQIFAQLRGFLGEEGAIAIEGMLKSVNLSDKGIIGTAIGVLMLLIGATTVLAELQSALDRVWRVPEDVKPKGWRGMLRKRLLSLGMVLGIGFLMIVSLVASAGVAALGNWWAPLFGGWELVLQAVNFAVSFGLVTAIFALIYKWMPQVRIAWHDVWIGAIVTAMLFTIGKTLISLYIGKSGVTSGFGAASSVVVLLVWVYYSAQIFLVGAEFTWVYAHRFGSKKGQERRADMPAPAPRRSA